MTPVSTYSRDLDLCIGLAILAAMVVVTAAVVEHAAEIALIVGKIA